MFSNGNMLAALIILAYALLVLVVQSLGHLETGVAALAWVPIMLVPLFLAYPDILLGLFVAHVFKFVSLLVLNVSIESVFVGEPLMPPLVIALSLLVGRRKIRLPLGALVLAQFLFYALLVSAAMRTGVTNEAVAKVWQFSYSNVMPFLCPLLFIGDHRRLRNILIGFWSGCVIWVIGGQLLGPGEVAARLSWVGLGAIDLGRAAGIASLFAMCVLVTSAERKVRLFLLPLAGWLLCLMVLSGTRGVLVAYMVGALAILVARWSQPSSRSVLAAACLLVAASVAVALYSAPVAIRERLIDPRSYQRELYADSASGNANRLWIYQRSWDMFVSSPITGLGPNAYRRELLYPHNLFLETATELGAVGLAVLAFFLCWTVKHAWQVLSGSGANDALGILMLLLFAGLVFYLAEAQFSKDIVGNREIWFFSGMIYALYASTLSHNQTRHDAGAAQKV